MEKRSNWAECDMWHVFIITMCVCLYSGKAISNLVMFFLHHITNAYHTLTLTHASRSLRYHKIYVKKRSCFHSSYASSTIFFLSVFSTNILVFLVLLSIFGRVSVYIYFLTQNTYIAYCRWQCQKVIVYFMFYISTFLFIFVVLFRFFFFFSFFLSLLSVSVCIFRK